MPKRPRASGSVGSGEAGGAEEKQQEEGCLSRSSTEQPQAACGSHLPRASSLTAASLSSVCFAKRDLCRDGGRRG